MEICQFFKANIAGKGYIRSWLNTPPTSEPGTTIIERSLLVPDTKSTSPPVVYSASLLAANQILIAIGSSWPEHSDQYGRKGLSFWHGAICVVPRLDNQEILAISNLLLGLVQRYKSGYEALGKIIAQLATKETTENWMTPFSRLLSGASTDIDDGTRSMIDNFADHVDRLPKSANLQLGYPLDKEFAIPLLCSLLARRKDVTRVAGGQLANIAPDQAQQISVPKNFPGYETFQVSSLLLYKDRKRDAPPAKVVVPQSSKRDKVVAAKNRKLLLLAIIEGLIILFLAFIILRSDLLSSVTPTPVTPTPITLTPEVAVCAIGSAESQLLVSVRLNDAQSRSYLAVINDENNQPLVSSAQGNCPKPSGVNNQFLETNLDCDFRFDKLSSTETSSLDLSLVLEGLEGKDSYEIPLSRCLIIDVP